MIRSSFFHLSSLTRLSRMWRFEGFLRDVSTTVMTSQMRYTTAKGPLPT